MSISVQNNPDGSFKITCGNQSVIVGGPAASPSTSGSTGFPPVTPTIGGVTAHIIDASVQRKIPGELVFNNVNEYQSWLHSQTRAALSAANVNLQFALHRTQTIDLEHVESLSKAAGIASPRFNILLRPTNLPDT